MFFPIIIQYGGRNFPSTLQHDETEVVFPFSLDLFDAHFREEWGGVQLQMSLKAACFVLD